MPKLLQFEVKTSSTQINNLFEVMEIRCLVIKFLIQITSTYSSSVFPTSHLFDAP